MAEQSPEYPEPRFYSREFKLEAVRLSETTDKSIAQIARELGVRERVLYRWRRELREDSFLLGLIAVQTERRRLRLTVRDLACIWSLRC